MRSFLYIPNMKPISLPPTPISPAGTSQSCPMCRHNSIIKDWQNLITSSSDLPLGSKSEPPFPPPIGKPVNEFLNICSKARNFRIEALTLGWNLSPPLYGPIAPLNWILKPRLTWTLPLSSTHGTLKWISRSGSTTLSTIEVNSGCASKTGSRDSKTSNTA